MRVLIYGTIIALVYCVTIIINIKIRSNNMCIVCQRIEMIKNDSNPYFVKEMDTGYVVIGDNQHFRGYTLFLNKLHETELFHLEQNLKLRHLEEMTIVAEAVSNVFHAEKMNYECLENGDSHIHWHLFPRVNGDIEDFGNKGKGPVWWYPMERMYDGSNKPSRTELEEMKVSLLKEINRILKSNS